MSRKKSLSNLSRQAPSYDEIIQIGEEVEKAPDRYAAIILCAHVDLDLGHRIIDVLPNTTKDNSDKLFDTGGALNSFFAKSHLGFAMGLYDETTLKNLEVLRRVRNQFAHSPRPIRFATPEIARACRNLTYGNDPKYGQVLEAVGINSDNVMARDRYLLTCMETLLSFQRLRARWLKNRNRRLRYRLKKMTDAIT